MTRWLRASKIKFLREKLWLSTFNTFFLNFAIRSTLRRVTSMLQGSVTWQYHLIYADHIKITQFVQHNRSLFHQSPSNRQNYIKQKCVRTQLFWKQSWSNISSIFSSWCQQWLLGMGYTPKCPLLFISKTFLLQFSPLLFFACFSSTKEQAMRKTRIGWKSCFLFQCLSLDFLFFSLCLISCKKSQFGCNWLSVMSLFKFSLFWKGISTAGQLPK